MVKEDDTQMQYYVYVLEANLAFADGMTISIISEILSDTEGNSDTKKSRLGQRFYGTNSFDYMTKVSIGAKNSSL